MSLPQLEPATSKLDLEATDVGSVFVSNYPPYGVWNEAAVPQALEALDSPGKADVPLGLYLHIPFCRKRCKFCYFRVFTDKNNEQIQGYLDALAAEVEAYGRRKIVEGRHLDFVYVGGGTPSYIAVKQLEPLVARLKAAMPWDKAREVAFECEPGTLTQSKLEAIRGIGVTRLSLGIENFDDDVLRENGRAHLSPEIERVRPWIEDLDFPQVNVDLISGMVGETWVTWRETVKKTIDWDPDSVTLYQMELPFNTVYSKSKLRGESEVEFADWKTKREWHAWAFEQFEDAGYEISSAYTVLKKGRDCRFVYRDNVWEGADMLGAGVSAFSHASGVHFQNVDGWDDYLKRSGAGEPTTARGFVTTAADRLVRETILQLKRGWLDADYFAEKFGVEIGERFAEPLGELEAQGLLSRDGRRYELSRQGLLRVDQLLPNFYDEEYRGSRYT